MRFERKLVVPEDPPENEQGELELPDDLAMLAAQLEDDARSLSGMFPAKRFEDQSAVANHPAVDAKESTNWLLAASLVTAACLVIAAGMWWRIESRAVQVVLPAKDPTKVAVDGSGGEDIPASDLKNPNSNAIENMAPMPAMFLKDFSGPELEGLYDLINESGDEDKLSI